MALNPQPNTIEIHLATLRIDDSKPPHGPTAVAAPPTPPFSPEPPVLPTAPTTFLLFPLLPAELRLQIWAASFLPRTVELHSRRAHYASTDTPCWHSKSRNPAALSVSAEARAAALAHYRVALPLDALPARHEHHVTLTGLKTCERPGDTLRGGDRRLYVDPTHDTVVLCAEVVFLRVKRLLDWFRQQDARGRGLRKLAMSVKAWAISGPAAQALKVFGRTLFGEIDEFYLFFYDDWVPPETWTGARCELVRLSPDEDVYRRFLMGKGRQFRDGDRWIVVGKRPMEVVEIRFHDEGW
ncbi:hypothetical protein B0T18DRAFT_440681 [Schizothecium vesticola]|uniref:2EXR domain-containing protein n=1 Tax=Schizothecium vesticola TaxID=314040 RepID=A0AA40ELB9_9PEZI|nr:hypothetical protein B0T18DRAFT_440681 [Schizothecium vesticola]